VDTSSDAPLLEDLRSLPGVQERKTGVFYRKCWAFLHLHEDGDAVFADVRLSGLDFERHRATTPAEQGALLRQIRRGLE
jgi:hypothetical protein